MRDVVRCVEVYYLGHPETCNENTEHELKRKYKNTCNDVYNVYMKVVFYEFFNSVFHRAGRL